MAPAAEARAEKPAQFRQPVALQLTPDQNHLLVANRRSGSISQIDVTTQRVVREFDVGEQLSDLAWIPQSPRALATDKLQHELIVLRYAGQDLVVTERVPVSPWPVSVVVSADGRRAYVASLWSRRLTIVRLEPEPPANDQPAARASVAATVDLPFAPREQLLVDERNRLVIADSFAGRLGVLDTVTGELILDHEVPAHNIRGLALSVDGQKLIIAQQMLNEVAHTVHNDVHWGLLMSNDLRWLSLESVLDETLWLYQDAHMVPLGGAGSATGDPAGLSVTADGLVVAALAGVHELAIGRERDYSLFRIDVGRRPTAVTTTSDGRTAYVANTLDDSISVVDLAQRQLSGNIPLGTMPRLTLADRGERLFFDARLSHDGWMSCHSCHTDGHSNGLLNDNLSDGSFGAPKRVLSLLGRSATAPFAWDGSVASVQEQIRRSISHTMRGDQTPSDRQVAALAAYLETLSPPPPIDLARGQRDEPAVLRGQVVFQAQRCDHCHTPPTYTSTRTYNVGLTDEKGNNRFNPPPLVGVGQRSALLHDGRARSLEEVFNKYKHRVRQDITTAELQDLIAFLRSL